MIGGGVLLLLFKQIGWNGLLPASRCSSSPPFATLFQQRHPHQPKEAHERAKKADVIYFFARRSIWKQIGFLFLYYSGLIGTLAMLKPWLVDLGYDMKEIGVMSGVAGTFVGFLSSFAGGMIVRRIGRFRARILFAVFVLMATLYFLGLSYVHLTTLMLYGGIFLLWGSYGMATIVVYTTAMDCVRPGREGTGFHDPDGHHASQRHVDGHPEWKNCRSYGLSRTLLLRGKHRPDISHLYSNGFQKR